MRKFNKPHITTSCIRGKKITIAIFGLILISACGWMLVPKASLAVSPTVILTASPASINSGNSTTLAWSSSDASSCTASSASPTNTQWSGSKAVSSSQSITNLTATTTFYLSCTSTDHLITVVKNVTVFVTWVTPPAITSFYASPTSVSSGDSATLTWSVANTTSCSASASPTNTQWSGSKAATSGSHSQSITNLTATTTTNVVFSLVCTGAGGSVTKTVAVTVTPKAPAQPTLLSPFSGSTVPSLTPTLQWNSVPGAGAYIWNVLYFDSGFATNTQATVSSGRLSWGQTYTWRVKACTDSTASASCSDWSSSWSFTTQAAASTPSVPTLISPTNGATNISTSPPFSWSGTLASGSWYNLNYKKSTDASYAAVSYLTASSYTLSGLSPSTTYNWVVQVCSSTVCTNSAIWSFTTQAAASTPTVPTLISPASGSTINTLTPPLKWNAVSGAGAYMWNVLYTAYGVVTGTQATVPAGELSWGQSYSWRVTACTDSSTTNCGNWSSQWSFTTQAAASTPTVPTLISPTNGATNISTSPPFSWSGTLASGSWYNLNYKKSTDASYAAVSYLTASSYTLSGLSPSTTYNWVVQVCSSTVCTNSAIWSFTTQAAVAAVPATPTITCTDSDGGKDYYTKGIAQDSGGTYTDYCLNTSALREYFCLASTLFPGGAANQEDYNCPYGCQNGVCLSATATPTPATCDSTSFTTQNTAFDFGTAGGNTVSNVCGVAQYYKITVPSGQTCTVKWTLQPDSVSDYDLYVRWGTGTLSAKNYDDESTLSKGLKDEVSKANLSTGTYYALVDKPYPNNTPGSYSITASLTNCTTPTTPATCDFLSFAAQATAYDFGSNGGTISNVCGVAQYYKVTVPSGQTCGIKWTLQPDSVSDYDLYVRWGTGALSKSNYDDKAVLSKGLKDEVSKTGLSAGTYYALVNKPYPDKTPGSYSITAILTNCTGLAVTPIPTPTPTTESQVIAQLTAQITQLTAQIVQLQAELVRMLAGQPSAWCYTFKQSLGYKDSGTADVIALQTALQKEGVYPGATDSYYGISTLEAVISFQEKYKTEVLIPWKLTRGTGFAGSTTIKKLNQLYGCK